MKTIRNLKKLKKLKQKPKNQNNIKLKNSELEECIGCARLFYSENMILDEACESYCHECWAILKEEIKTTKK